MSDFAPSARAVSEILDDCLAGRRISAGRCPPPAPRRRAADPGRGGAGGARPPQRPGGRDLHRRPQHQLHQRLRLQCRFCAFYRAPGRRRGIPALQRGDRRRRSRRRWPRRHRRPDAGRAQPRPAARVLRGPAALPARAPSRRSTCTASRRRRSSSSPGHRSAAVRDVDRAPARRPAWSRFPAAAPRSSPTRSASEVLAYQRRRPRSGSTSCAPAHRLGMRTTATMMFGMGETLAAARRAPAARPRPAGRDRRLHRLHRLDLPGREHRRCGDAEVSGDEYLKTLAVSPPLPRQHPEHPVALGHPGQEDRPGWRSPSAPTTWARS